MKLRAAISAIATVMVAVVVALTVPISQLRTFSTNVTCCCPDPLNCHCPHEKPGSSQDPTMKPCHQERHDSVSPQLPSFTTPEVATAVASRRIADAPVAAPGVPHEEPGPSESYGPS